MKGGAIEICDEEGNEFIVNKQRVKPYQKDISDFDADEDVTLDDQGGVTLYLILLKSRLNDPNIAITDMNNLESDDESVDTPLVSPFHHSDNESDDGEVLNELIKKFVAYFDPFLPMNIIMRSFTYITDFVVLEDIGEFIMSDMAEVLMGKPFRKITMLKYDIAKGLVSFTKIFDTKFLIKNEEEIFTVPGDGVGSKTRRRRVSGNVKIRNLSSYIDEKKLGNSFEVSLDDSWRTFLNQLLHVSSPLLSKPKEY
ncbi:hypothetical protein Tco_0822530 [Tanacetum coccineum]|uniref:Uncharacterized protein n=1 Tax=Tanacetum coccineum TaxID=301880 RepID=A0ABQ5AGE1_9ASTR